MNSRLDAQAVRSVADLESIVRKKFTEAYGLADDARSLASSAEKKAQEAMNAATKPSHEAVFNALTEGGKCQGLFRDPETGNVYLNAEFIKSGILRGEAEIFIPPGQQEYDKIVNHNEGYEEIPSAEIPLYDFNGNGVVDGTDRYIARLMLFEGKTLEEALGLAGVGSWAGVKYSTVKFAINVKDPEKTISFSATNMWGRKLDFSIGINSAIFADENMRGLYRITNGEKEWLSPPFEEGVEYKTVERCNGAPVYKKIFTIDFDTEGSKTVDTGISIYDQGISGVSYVFDDGWFVLPQGSQEVEVYLSKGMDTYQLTVGAQRYGSCRVKIEY